MIFLERTIFLTKKVHTEIDQMQKIDIYSKRKNERWPSWDIVYEWEDIFSKEMGVPIKDAGKLEVLHENRLTRKIASTKAIKEVLQFIDRALSSKKVKHIAFEMDRKSNLSYSNSRTAIPLLIDFWSRDYKTFFETYQNAELICLSNLEVVNFLKSHGCPLNIRHLPLSLPDSYKIENTDLSRKKYDIILAGRRNPILWGFLQTFEAKYPEVEYLYQEQLGGRLVYKSNKNGVIGEFHSRGEYMTLLQQCRISFYSTPGIDGGEKRTHGFNPVTPRFLELLSAKCLLLGRYPDNEDVNFYQLPDFCPHVDTYEDFELVLSKYMNLKSPDFSLQTTYLEQHYTSKRASQLKSYILETFNYECTRI